MMRDKTSALDATLLLSWWKEEEEEDDLEEDLEHLNEDKEDEQGEEEFETRLKSWTEERDEGTPRWLSSSPLDDVWQSCYGRKGTRALTIYQSQLMRRQSQLEVLKCVF